MNISNRPPENPIHIPNNFTNLTDIFTSSGLDIEQNTIGNMRELYNSINKADDMDDELPIEFKKLLFYERYYQREGSAIVLYKFIKYLIKSIKTYYKHFQNYKLKIETTQGRRSTFFRLVEHNYFNQCIRQIKEIIIRSTDLDMELIERMIEKLEPFL